MIYMHSTYTMCARFALVWCGTVESRDQRPNQDPAQRWITAPLIGAIKNIYLRSQHPIRIDLSPINLPMKCCYQLTKWSRLQVKQIISLRVNFKRYMCSIPPIPFTTISSSFPLCGQLDFPMNYYPLSVPLASVSPLRAFNEFIWMLDKLCTKIFTSVLCVEELGS